LPTNCARSVWPSSTTQFVVGAADETDLELLTTTEYLHRNAGLARAYFSGFAPVDDTPLENRPPSPPLRERRRGRLRHLSDLRKIGVVAGRAAPFILLDGRRPPRQLTLWPT
jgi:predicted DNA-binding helix-hairpin-helix protein